MFKLNQGETRDYSIDWGDAKKNLINSLWSIWPLNVATITETSVDKINLITACSVFGHHLAASAVVTIRNTVLFEDGSSAYRDLTLRVE